MSSTPSAPTGGSRTPFVVVIMLLLLALVLALWRPWGSHPEPPPEPVIAPNAKAPQPFELIITTLVQDRQRLEVLKVSLEYWKQHRVKRDIITVRRGSLTDQVTRLAPDWVKDFVLDQDWNKTEAEIITKCEATVEFEVDFADAKAWKLVIAGDTAVVQAPAFVADEVNVPPEKVVGWVISEDFIISGEHEKEVLLKNIRTALIPHVNSDKFRNEYRERCRRNLERFLARLLAAFGDERARQVKHVDVHFADDPPER